MDCDTGNKVYGVEWNEDLIGCPGSDGSEDMEGNLAAHSFRRLEVGSFMQQVRDLEPLLDSF